MADTPINNGPTDPHGYGQEVPPVTQIGPVTIGHVGFIHGEEGRPCPEYIPTKHELRILAEHWTEVIKDIHVSWEDEGVSSSDMRIEEYALQRIKAIGEQIGTE